MRARRYDRDHRAPLTHLFAETAGRQERMKVVTATSQTQGWRDNDFCWTVEGELLFFAPLECGRGSIDDNCGCRHSMAGLWSHRATTTMKVIERSNLNPATTSH